MFGNEETLDDHADEHIRHYSQIWSVRKISAIKTQDIKCDKNL